MRKLAILAIFAMAPCVLSAARLTLRDGSVVYGQFVSGNTNTIVFQDQTGARRQFNMNQVQTLDFTPVAAPMGNNNTYAPGSYSQGNAYRSDERYQHDWSMLPAGSEISVRNDETIDSANAAPGSTYPASIARDVLDQNGNVLIPRGSAATLVVRQVNQGGTLSNGDFILDLDSVQVNGRRYIVNTADLEARDRNGIGKNRRTGEMVGGGAALGTLLGAIAGGGKGAAIGAIAGAAAGGGAQVLTKGHRIRVPAETVLNFRLDQPLHLREAM